MMTRRLPGTFILLFATLIKIVSSTTYTCSSNASCGCSTNPAVVTKIVGGEPALSQTWGWVVSLRHSSTGSHFCGGSIISSSHILTAAHCAAKLSSPSSVKVYAGSIFLSSTVQERSVSKISINPYYSSSTYLNDIAILKLSSPLDFGQNGVGRVCLPNVSSTVLSSGEYPPAGLNLVAIGWGVLQEGSQTMSPILQQVTVQSIPANSSYCQNVELSDAYTQLCAGVMPAGGKDTCQGDSGGPLLMFTSTNVWQQVGITSIGVGCARPDYPGIYTRVAAFQSWINATMNSGNQVFPILHTIFISFLLLNLF